MNIFHRRKQAWYRWISDGFRTLRNSENLDHLFRYSRSAGCFTRVGAKSAPCPRRGLRAYSKVLARKADILFSNKLKLHEGLLVAYLRSQATSSSASRNFSKRILHVPRFTGFVIACNDGFTKSILTFRNQAGKDYSISRNVRFDYGNQ